jgi:D-tyrosyl-tRNA(Tyr) deacylase
MLKWPMKLVIQRVNEAEVKTNGEVVGKIGKGLFVLVGIKKGDSEKEAKYLADKLLKLRLMSDKHSKMNLSVIDAEANLLVVSQFTLYANTNDGNRPSFVEAEVSEKARALYDYFVDKLKESNLNVHTGKFGEYMRINAELDGPVTIFLEK